LEKNSGNLLGRGHSMALWKYFVEKELIKPAKSLLKPMKKSSNK
jgi:hypothetical protein